ncbi:MAG TPA: VOC family protein [Gemmataceae bacterium]|nr:VOC family protein [Gemmataceae bacterium]
MHNGTNGVRSVPEGYHTLTPHLVVRGAAAAIDFYKQAFGATEICRHVGPDGQSLMHAQLRIGDSLLFLADEFPQCRSPQALGGSPVTLALYVEDCDAVFKRAVAAGATVRMPLADMFWGDRYGCLIDPFGHVWSVATHKEDVPPEELARRAQAAFAHMGKGAAEPAAV